MTIDGMITYLLSIEQYLKRQAERSDDPADSLRAEYYQFTAHSMAEALAEMDIISNG